MRNFNPRRLGRYFANEQDNSVLDDSGFVDVAMLDAAEDFMDLGDDSGSDARLETNSDEGQQDEHGCGARERRKALTKIVGTGIFTFL